MTNPETVLKRALESNALRGKADALIESGVDVLELRQVAAMLHVLSSELAENRDKGHQEVALLLQCLESLRKTAETIERIRASKAFTNAERDWIVLALGDFVEMMPDEMKAQFHEFISQRLLGNKIAPLPMASGTV